MAPDDNVSQAQSTVNNQSMQNGKKDARFSISPVSAQIKKKFGSGLDDLFVYESDLNGDIQLSSIMVKKELQKTGVGTKIMQDIVLYADDSGKKLP